MSLNPTGTNNYNWNYSNPQKENYSETLIGTVLAIQEVQARTYNPNTKQQGQPRFWPDGNPVLNIRIAFADQNGCLKTFTFQPAGKAAREGTKPSIHMDLYKLTGYTDMENLISKTIKIQTWPSNPQTGQAWMIGNPRQFEVSLVNEGPYQLTSPTQLPNEYKIPVVLCNDAVSGGQVVQQGVAPQMIQQPVPIYQAGPMYSQPPVQQMQPVMQQAQPTIPAGMDPQVAAAMQNVGAVNVQPVAGSAEVYSEDIPF